jgi:hypothetical protein
MTKTAETTGEYPQKSSSIFEVEAQRMAPLHQIPAWCADLRNMDQLQELRGCDKRLTACMLDRLGDLRH